MSFLKGMFGGNKNKSKRAPPPTEAVPKKSATPELTFHAQLAHGSSTEKLGQFSNLTELYASIAKAFNIEMAEIIFCTLNTHKCDMERLLGGQIGLEDFIFAHVKGEKTRSTVNKTESSLGLTITDNGAGYPFIKRIKPDSIVSRIPDIKVGNMIERIGDKNMVGMRHFQVAKSLRDIPVGTVFDITCIEPKKAFDMIKPRTAPASTTSNVKDGKATLRIKSKGQATVEEAPTPIEEQSCTRIDELLESFMGIRDMDLARTIFDCGKNTRNPDEFVTGLNTMLGEFGFPQEFIFDVWGVLLDARANK